MLVLCAASVWQANAQTPTWDSSGNGLLNGTYYFREVLYVVGDSTGDLSEATAVYGTINFSGSGAYSIQSGTYVDSGGAAGNYSSNGTYTFGANGYGFFTSPLSSLASAFTSAKEYGLVGSSGVIVASMTENGFNDIFIAAPIGTQASASNFSGSYTVDGFFPGGTPATAADATFQLNPNGAGSLGNISVSGYFGGGGSTVYTQSLSNIAYKFSNGAGVLSFPSTTSSTAYYFSGQEYMYISSDRNFIFGGNPLGFDMFVGIKNNPSGTTPSFNGFYYEAGLDQDTSTLASSGYAAFDSYFGSYNANAGTIVGHERLFTPLYNSVAEGFTYNASYPKTITNSTYTDSGGDTTYTFGNGGAIRIGYGIGPYLSLSVGVQAATLSGSGVYLSPQGITNAANFAPFTAGVSPGEYIVLYGSGMAPNAVPQVASSLPFPKTLNGVSVTVDGIQAPIYYESATQISVIVPYLASYFPLASIQINNNGALSNIVTSQVNLTTPGIFTLTANGLGDGAIEHANGSVVTASNPAQPGETVAVYMSGLGAVFPPVTEGAATPSSPLPYTTNTIASYIGGTQATVAFAGLTPSAAGLYQMNITVPAGATSGENALEIVGPDSDNFQATIEVGTGSASASARPGVSPESVVRRPHRNAERRFTPAPLPCVGGNPACR
jgi:uncharacterized protein (TIGR03437 family)